MNNSLLDYVVEIFALKTGYSKFNSLLWLISWHRIDRYNFSNWTTYFYSILFLYSWYIMLFYTFHTFVIFLHFIFFIFSAFAIFPNFPIFCIYSIFPIFLYFQFFYIFHILHTFSISYNFFYIRYYIFLFQNENYS